MRHFLLLVCTIAIGLTLGACSMGNSESSSSSAAATSDPPPDLSTANPPYTIASTNDLAIFSCHVHQDYYYDPQHFVFWWSVRSTFSSAVTNVDWKIERLDGPAQPALHGTISSIAAHNMGGDGHDYHAPWTEQNPGGRHMYRLTIDPDGKIAEASKSNNSYVFIVDVPSTAIQYQQGDLLFWGQEAHVHCDQPNAMYMFHFQVKNSSSTAVPATKWRLQAPDLGIDQLLDLGPISAGGIAEAMQDIAITAPGIHDVTITIDSANAVTETNESNNTRTFHLLVGPPSGSG